MGRAKTILVISDMQVPYHSAQAVDNLIEFTASFKPDVLVNVGDDVDSPQPSQWSKGMAGEYAGDLQKHMDMVAEIHGRFRSAIGTAPYHVSRSNHGDRVQKYIARYAPALTGLRALQLPALAGYDAHGIEYHTQPFTIAPGWVCCHGDEGPSSAIPGRTAGLLADRWGVSVVCGHTHSAGISPTSRGFGGQVSTVWGCEVGHIMDMEKATYLAAGHANWQQSFGLLYQVGARVTPVLVPIHKGGVFEVEGVTYGT